MSNLIQQTLCIIKPDGIRRGLVGEVFTRIERTGLKIIAVKMLEVDDELAKKHYLYEDIVLRHGKTVWESLIKFITSSPILVFIVEGIEAVEVVRKICGLTEPKNSSVGTIRGDFAHHSFSYADEKGYSIYNIIHSSANLIDSKREIALWFSKNEILCYKRDDEAEHYF